MERSRASRCSSARSGTKDRTRAGVSLPPGPGARAARLSVRGSEAFVYAPLNPQPANGRLRDMVRRYREQAGFSAWLLNSRAFASSRSVPDPAVVRHFAVNMLSNSAARDPSISEESALRETTPTSKRYPNRQAGFTALCASFASGCSAGPDRAPLCRYWPLYPRLVAVI